MMHKFLLVLLGLPKTILLNFILFDFWDAIRMPLVLAPGVSFKFRGTKKGSVTLGIVKPGIVNIGFFEGIGSSNSCKTIIDIRNNGKIVFNGKACIAKGSYLLTDNGTINIGENFHGGNNLIIVSRRNISIGNNVLTSWNCTIMDSDGHDIYDRVNGQILNLPSNITIENNVWIGCNVTILKKSTVPEGAIIAANTCFHFSDLENKDCILANKSNAEVVLKKDIEWHL